MTAPAGERPAEAALAPRRRPTLVLVAAASAALGLLGLAGVFAVVSDRATTGENSVEVGDYPEPADLELLIAERSSEGTCGEFSDDLTTGLVDATADAFDDAGSPLAVASVCLRNAGLYPGYLSMVALDVDDRDIGCTAREQEVDDTCGDDGPGELAQSLLVTWRPCGYTDDPDAQRLAVLAAQSSPIGWIDVDETVELCLGVEPHPDLQPRAVQSDEVTWRFGFDLTDQPVPACLGEDLEPNHEPSRAIELTIGAPQVYGTICDWSDVDLYRVEVTSVPATIDIVVQQGEVAHLHGSASYEEWYVPAQVSPLDPSWRAIEITQPGTWFVALWSSSAQPTQYAVRARTGQVIQ